ncbi:DUF167 family protein [Devosia rhodophyticola]|uniref:UPF0235 protein PSQ90_08610 n=1 Tax=Devosia rhodophyticola TaxID=3026423 RepID=A0ABY7YSR5_9HYPH|nr:DUF167 family protein [Devosia rhodophyticola]WDR04413.1 DUF167 family protein [Devosia rhodophyticola]
MALCYRREADGLSLFVRVTPNAGRNGIDGIEVRDDGCAVLPVRVSAVPDKGRANLAVIALLAKQFGLPKSDISVTAGATARLKTLFFSAEPDRIIQQLTAL